MHIYLAGPEVFFPDAKDIGEEKKRLCTKYEHVGFFPLDNEFEDQYWETCPRWTIGMDIAKANRELIHDCDAVIANLTPFRGPSADPGTVWEVGYAAALNKIVLGYTSDGRKYIDRVNNGAGWDGHGHMVEDFDLNDNLMIQGGLSSPLVVVNSSGSLTSLAGFEKCLQELNKSYIVEEY